MRKFLICLVAALLMLSAPSCTSCKTDVQFGIEYSLQSEGKVEGNVDVIFNGGSFDLNGEAGYNLSWSNTVLLRNANTISLEKALLSKDDSMVKAANNVNNWFEENIKVTSAGGTYDVHIKGYVKETATGFMFEIDRRFTNLPTDIQYK